MTRFPHTWHVAFCFPTLDPFATLIPPVVLIGQDYVYVHIIVDGWIQTTGVEAQEWKHPPGQTHKGKMICTQFYDKMLAEEQERRVA